MNSLGYHAYLDKVLGGWYGKCLGGTVGCFEGTKRITHIEARDMLPDKMLPNDDLDMQLIWMDVLLEYGVYFLPDHMMQAWLEEYPYNFGEYSVARRNFRRGLHASECGSYANFFFHNSMGCPIRSDIWGLIAPGAPDLAARYAYQDGTLDHDSESVWAEQFLAAMTAEAFFESDLHILIDRNLRFFPEESITLACIRLAMGDFDAGLPWQETWKRLRDRFGHPDNTYAPLNLGFLVMALLHGGGDLEKTLNITLNSAWDVDCTCSSSAALLGVISGYKAIGEPWKSHVGDRIETFASPKHAMSSLGELADDTVRAAMTLLDEGFPLPLDAKDFPASIQRLSTRHYETPVRLSADYLGAPAISAYEPKKMQILLASEEHSGQGVKLSFSSLPRALTPSWEEITVCLDRNGKAAVPLVISLKAGEDVLPDTNLFTLNAQIGGKDMGQYTFGLCGAPSVLISEPFYDTYMEWLDMEKLPPERIIRSNGDAVIIPWLSDEYGSHQVDLHKPYLKEDFSDTAACRLAMQGAEKGSVWGDIIAIKEHYGFQGPVCVYQYMEVIPPQAEPVDLFVGSSDPFRLWVNGELVLEQEENRFYYPYQSIKTVQLRAGANAVMVKIARKGPDNQFSLVFRKKNDTFAFDGAPVLTDLRYRVF